MCRCAGQSCSPTVWRLTRRKPGAPPALFGSVTWRTTRAAFSHTQLWARPQDWRGSGWADRPTGRPGQHAGHRRRSSDADCRPGYVWHVPGSAGFWRRFLSNHVELRSTLEQPDRFNQRGQPFSSGLVARLSALRIDLRRAAARAGDRFGALGSSDHGCFWRGTAGALLAVGLFSSALRGAFIVGGRNWLPSVSWPWARF